MRLPLGAWREHHLKLPWHEMIGMRNQLVHAYFTTELFILHEVATKLLPPLLPRLQAIVDAAD